MVKIRHNKDFLAPRSVTGVLERLSSFFSSWFGEEVAVDSRVHIDASRLMMGSIEIEESIVARPNCVPNSIENSLYDMISYNFDNNFAAN